MVNLIKRVKKVRRKIVFVIDNLVFKKKNRQETFKYIYEKKIWGRGGVEPFYSGPGSCVESYVASYCKLIQSFIAEHDIRQVVDLGCGDFKVASQWITEYIQYNGVDIVPELVNYNNEKYGKKNVSFSCLDIVTDDLPDGELCLIRQVLQHLSNSEILQILNKIKKYKYVIVTEHITAKEYAHKYNIDKEHGSCIRALKQSGVYLDEEPFNMKVEKLLEIPYSSQDEEQKIVSMLIKTSSVP